MNRVRATRRGTSEVISEFIGTAFLLAAIVGSSTSAQRLTPDAGLQLLIGAVTTGAVLAAVIVTLQPFSGAHLNPAVTLTEAALGAVSLGLVIRYVIAQVAGGLAGTILANLMFGSDAMSISEVERSGGGILLGESIATAGLILVIVTLARSDRQAWIGPAVGAYIAGAFFFTSSTAFANPAVTLGRIFTDAPAGIAPSSVPLFLGAEVLGIALALTLVLLLDTRR